MTENEYLILQMVIQQGDVLEEDFHRLYMDIPLLEFDAGTAYKRLLELKALLNYWDDKIGRRSITTTELGKRIYKQELQKKQDEQDQKNKTTEKLNNELKIGQNTIKYWWLPMVIAGSSAVISLLVLYTNWHFHNADNKQKQELQDSIADLRTRLQQTNTRTLYVVDSLWKTEHKSDSSKR